MVAIYQGEDPDFKNDTHNTYNDYLLQHLQLIQWLLSRELFLFSYLQREGVVTTASGLRVTLAK